MKVLIALKKLEFAAIISDEDEVELWRRPIPMLNVFRLGTMMLGFLDRENNMKIGSTKILHFRNTKGMFIFTKARLLLLRIIYYMICR